MKTCKDGSRRGCKVVRIIGMVIAGLIFAVLFALAFGFIVQYLWNWLMPGLFGLKTITFLQAFVLIILSKILFSGIGHSRGRHGENGRHGHCSGRFHHHLSSDFSHDDWKHFHQFWKEEGKSVFSNYIKRMEKDCGTSSSDKDNSLK